MKISQSHEFRMTHKVLLAKKDQPHRIKATMYRTMFCRLHNHLLYWSVLLLVMAADDAAMLAMMFC